MVTCNGGQLIVALQVGVTACSLRVRESASHVRVPGLSPAQSRVSGPGKRGYICFMLQFMKAPSTHCSMKHVTVDEKHMLIYLGVSIFFSHYVSKTCKIHVGDCCLLFVVYAYQSNVTVIKNKCNYAVKRVTQNEFENLGYTMWTTLFDDDL